MLADPMSLDFTGDLAPAVYELMNLANGASERKSVVATAEEWEMLRVRPSQVGKGGAIVYRRNVELDHVTLNSTDATESHVKLNLSLTYDQTSATTGDALAVAWRMFCRMVSFAQPTGLLDVDDAATPPAQFVAWFNGQP